MQAVILAAGKGTRLKPLTKYVHKCMIPFYDKPFLEYLLESVVSTGRIDELVLVVGYREDEIISHFGDEFHGIPVNYRSQEPLQGTADALLQARDLLEGKFLTVLGDVYTSPDGLINMFGAPGEVTLAVTEVDDPENHASVGIKDGRVRELREDNYETVDRGVWVFDETIFDYLSRVEKCRGEFRILEAIQKLVDQGGFVNPKKVKEDWLQIGDHEGWRSLIKLKDYFSQILDGRTVKNKHDGSLVENSSVDLAASGCEIRDSLIFGSGSLENCLVENCVFYTDQDLRNGEFEEGFVVKTG